MRSGTENVAGVIGFACALALADETRADEAKRVSRLRDQLQELLCAEFPQMIVSGPKNAKLRLPNLLHVSFPGLEARRLVILLERLGVSVGTGSACAASKMQISHVLEDQSDTARSSSGKPQVNAWKNYHRRRHLVRSLGNH